MKPISKLRFFLISFAFTFIVFPMRAQWSLGLQAGYTHNSLTTSSSYFYDRVFHPQGGFTLGLPVQYAFTDWFSVGCEATFIQKSYETHRSGYYSILHEEVNNNYLSIPLYAHFSFGGTKLKGFLNAGGYFGGWLSSHAKGTYPSVFSLENSIGNGSHYEDDMFISSYNQKMQFDSRRDNRFEAGGMMGIGMSYLLSPQIQLLGECRYYHSLTDMQKDYMKGKIPRYNNTFAFQAGILFLLGK